MTTPNHPSPQPEPVKSDTPDETRIYKSVAELVATMNKKVVTSYIDQCHRESDMLGEKLAAAKEEIETLKVHLRDANKGARINALVNLGLTEKVRQNSELLCILRIMLEYACMEPLKRCPKELIERAREATK